MAGLENFDDQEPVEGEIVPPEQPQDAKLKNIAKMILVLGGLYLLNPIFGVDLLPDNLPILGNLDEVLAVFMMIGSVRYLGIEMPGFLDRMMQTPLGLPAPRKPRDTHTP